MTEWARRCVLCAARGRVTKLESGHVCGPCEQRILDDLSDILRFAADATTEPRTGTGGGSRSVPGSKPPINVDGIDPALTILDLGCGPTTVLATLEEWERLTREARQMAPYGVASAARGAGAYGQTSVTLTGCVGFLRASVPWWTESPDQPIDDFAGEVRACRRALSKWDTAREPLGYVAFCPTDECGARIRYHSASEQVTCPRCHVTRDVPQLVAVVMSGDHDDIWADVSTAALHYGVSERRVRQLVALGQVERKAGKYRIATRKAGPQQGTAS